MPIYSERPGAQRGPMLAGTLLAAAVMLSASMWPSPADAGVSSPQRQTDDASSLLHFVEAIRKPSVGARCVRAQQNRGTFQLVNRCPICRSVQIQHSRPNNLPPAMRDYYLPPNGKIDLPFKGKGRTRVLHDTPCEQNDKEAKSAEKTSQACVRIRPGTKGLVLVNVCSICKAGIVERLYKDGRRDQQTLAVAQRAFTTVSANGATSARLVAETPCR